MNTLLTSTRKKSIFLLLTVFLLSFSFSYADNYGVIFHSGETADDRIQVYDEDYFLSDEELDEVYTNKIEPLIAGYGAEIVVILTESLDVPVEEEQEVLDTAYYDGGYGLGDEQTGAILYVNYKTGSVRVAYYGLLGNLFDERQVAILDEIMPFLNEGEVPTAINIFTDDIQKYMKEDLGIEVQDDTYVVSAAQELPSSSETDQEDEPVQEENQGEAQEDSQGEAQEQDQEESDDIPYGRDSVMFKPGITYEERKHVYDYDSLLKDEEVDNLLKNRIDELASKYGIETVVFLTNSIYVPMESEKSTLEAAYDGSVYGLTDNKTGAVLYINYSTRRVYCAYFGELKSIYSGDDGYMAESLTSYLKENDTIGAIDAFCDDLYETAANMGELGADGKRVRPSYFYYLKKYLGNIWVWVISFVIALAADLVPFIDYRGKKTVTARTYENSADFDLTVEKDSFVRSHTTRVKIERSSSSSSGGGGGGSSSGGGASF